MAKQIATLRMTADGIKANFLAIPKRAVLCSLRAVKDFTLKPGEFGFVNVYAPKVDLKDRQWMFKPRYLSSITDVKGERPLRDVHLMPCSFDAEHNWIPVNNLTQKPITIYKDTHLGSATELTEYDIPIPDDWSLDIDVISECSEQKPETAENVEPKNRKRKQSRGCRT